MKNECKKYPYKHVLYLKKEVGGNVLYTDDLIFTNNHLVIFESLKRSMVKEFEMMEWAYGIIVLGIEVVQSEKEILYHKKTMQEKFLRSLTWRNAI